MAVTVKLKKDVVNVRMYFVGFGDCFVLSFPHNGGHSHVLVDCGAHNKGSLDNLPEVVESIRLFTGGKLAAVVATHRHQDHIWGFHLAQELFRTKFEIGEVWLPWVEDLRKAEVKQLWKKHQNAVKELHARINAAPAGPRREAAAAILANLSPNQEALSGLRSHFGKAQPNVRYLAAGDQDLLAPAGIGGLTVKILGPPKSEEFLKKMNPPKAERWEFAASSSGRSLDRLFESPFDKEWEFNDELDAFESDVFTPEAKKEFREQMSNPLDLAFALEDAVNNTSLCLLFLFGGQGLLMPGDAQWGNWKYWYEQATSKDILDQVTLYKVGHHGSHNATPKSVVNKLPQNVAVMVPTYKEPFETIPDPHLFEALEDRSGKRVVRSDSDGPLPKGFSRGKLWIDYTVKI